ncbi:hypothetical protein JKP88DRAFT_242408 [Tribonema minus]|uniref:Replication origin-binding protein domain-containing protein n=1 Tax=Tribonema minus TaxID=303371 RepID=A0A835YJ71_9STRA|nr:hypothetical protein JKP88DRAFT_242408 [Tribonema minus]
MAAQFAPHLRREFRSLEMMTRLNALIAKEGLVHAMNNHDKATKRAAASTKKEMAEIDKKDLWTLLRQLARIQPKDGYVNTEHYLCAGYFRDWDIAACHHAILVQLCARYGIPCPKRIKYVENPKAIREKVRNALGFDYDTAKELLIGLTFGKAPKWDDVPINSAWVVGYSRECRAIRFGNALCGKNGPYASYTERAHGQHKEHTVLSALSAVIGEIENSILKAFVDAVPEVDVSILVFDGFMTHGPVPEGYTDTLEKAAFDATGFRVRVEEKPVNEVTLEELEAKYGEATPPEVVTAPPEVASDEEPVPQGTPSFGDPDIMIAGKGKKPNGTIIGAAMIGSGLSMGQGKTYAAVQAAKAMAALGKKTVFVSPRKSLIASARTRFEAEGLKVVEYGDLPKGEIHYILGDDVILIEYESLHRLKVDWKHRYALVILDEWATICNTIDSPTNGVYKMANYAKLEDLCDTAEKIGALDALMHATPVAAEQLRILMLHRKQQRAMYLIETNRCALIEEDAKSCEVYFYDRPGHVKRRAKLGGAGATLSRAKGKTAAGKRIWVNCLGKRHGMALADVLGKICGRDKFGFFSADTDNKAELYDMDAHFEKYQVIITTPTITVGCDYTGEIDSVFVFPCTHSCLPRDCYQMTGRARNVTTNHIYIAVDHKNYHSIIESVLADTDSVRENCAEQTKEEYERQTQLELCFENRFNGFQKELVFTLDRDDAVYSKKRTPDGLKLACAAAKVEKRYSESIPAFLGFLAARYRSSGFEVVADTTEMADAEQCAKEVREQGAVLKADEAAALVATDVEKLMGDSEALGLLKRLSTSLPLRPEETAYLQGEYPDLDRSLSSIKNRILPGALVNARQRFPTLSHEQAAELVPYLASHSHHLRRWDVILKTDPTLLKVDFVKSMVQNGAMSTQGPHDGLVAMHLYGLLGALGITDPRDRTTKVHHHEFDAEGATPHIKATRS